MPNNSDLHVDHKIISHCTVVATRPINGRQINLPSYETLSETEWAFMKMIKFYSKFFIALSNKNLNDKIKSFKYFKPKLKINYTPFL